MSSVLKRIPLIGRFFEQKGLLADTVGSLFSSDDVKPPRNLKTYRTKYNTDPTIGVSIDTLSEMTAGCGSYNTVIIDGKKCPLQCGTPFIQVRKKNQ